jgi:hypothetical protein
MRKHGFMALCAWGIASLALVGCVTEFDRCQQYYSGDLVTECQRSVRATGNRHCFHRHLVHSHDPAAYRECSGLEVAPEKSKADVAKAAAEERVALEQRCEEEAKARNASFYDCMRYYEEREERGRQLQQDREIADEAERRAADREAREAERRNEEEWARTIEQVGDMFKPKPSVTCRSRPSAYGGTETVCE